MEQEQPLHIFTQDPRYAWRERIALIIFFAVLAVGFHYREPILMRFDVWRLMAGVNEWDALYDLAERGEPAIPYLRGHLDDADADVRFRTMLCLKAMHEPEAVKALEPLMGDPDVTIRVNAMDAMAELRHRPAIPVLLDGLSSEEERVRRQSDRCLRQITGEDFDYEENSDPEEREAAINRWTRWWEREGST